MHTGKDEYGVFFPLVTRSFDDYKSMLPVYPMVLSIKLFGLNEIGVRFPTALISTLTIILIYLVAKKLLMSEKVALLASFFFAIEPWALHLGRVYHEAVFSLFFYFSALYLFFESMKKKKLILLSIIFGFVSLYSYHTSKILVPLTFILIGFLYRNRLITFPRKVRIMIIILMVIGILIFIYQILFFNTLARAESASILRDVSWRNLPIQATLRYVSYFLPSNLFVLEPNEPASVVPGNSMFFPYEIILWFIGLLTILTNTKKYRLLILLIAVSPLAASFTWNWFEPARVLVLFGLFSMIVGLGAYVIWKKGLYMHRIVYLIFFVPMVIMSVFYIFDSINYKIAAKIYGNWQPGFRESMPIVYEKSFNYKSVVIDTKHAQPYIFVLFYSDYPPEKYLNELDLVKIGNPRKNYNFGKYIFRNVDFATEIKDPELLYVLWKDSQAYSQIDIKEISYLNEVKNVDNDTIVKIVSFKNAKN